MKKITAAVAALFALASFNAAAGTITISNTGLTGLTASTGFAGSSLGLSQTMTNQFAAEGITFTGNVKSQACSNTNWSGHGITGNNVTTLRACGTDTTSDSFSMLFAKDISSLSLRVYSYDLNKNDSFQLRLNGALVNSFALYNITSQGVTTSNGTVLGFLNISGFVFDELRFTENSNTSDRSYLIIDGVATRKAVPEPGSLALLGLGAAALALVRRRRQG